MTADSSAANALSGANRLMRGAGGRMDGHAHVFRYDLPMAPGRHYTPTGHALLPDYAGLLRDNGLAGAILVQPSFLGSDNAFLHQSLIDARDAGGLTMMGVAVLDPNDPGWRADMARGDALGVIGLRLNFVGRPDAAIDLSLWEPVIRAGAALGWHVELHCEGARLAPVLGQALQWCETVVVDHFGLPAAPDCPGHAAILNAPLGRVLVKASAPYRVFPDRPTGAAARACQPLFDAFLSRLGPEHMLWGSDWPWTRFEARHDYRTTLEWRRDWLRPIGP